MWSGTDHSRVASKGYRQTGPELPMEGLWYTEDIFPDLLKVLEKFNLGSQPADGTVATTIRDEAIAHVDAEWAAGRVQSWVDARLLIEEHDDEDEPVEEGLEAYSYDPTDNEGDDPENGDDGDDDGCGGGDGNPRQAPLPPPPGGPPDDFSPTGSEGEGGGGGPHVAAGSAQAPSQHVEGAASTALGSSAASSSALMPGTAPTGDAAPSHSCAAAGLVPAAGSQPTAALTLAAAIETLIADARANGNDDLL